MRDFIIYWNNKFQFDYWYRRKYNIAFNSPVHRDTKPYDVKVEFLEERIIENEQIRAHNKEVRLEKFKETGSWLEEGGVDENKQDELFEMIKF